jgi:hypothetical protein
VTIINIVLRVVFIIVFNVIFYFLINSIIVFLSIRVKLLIIFFFFFFFFFKFLYICLFLHKDISVYLNYFKVIIDLVLILKRLFLRITIFLLKTL